METSIPRLLTVEEAAGALAVSARMIERLVRNGDLRIVRVGRLRRVPQADVEAFIGCAPEREGDAV